MFCEKCGTENPDDASFCTGCGHKFGKAIVKEKKKKDMTLALLISFILTGLGIAYAGNVKKGAILFVAGTIFILLGLKIPICALIGILIWVYAFYQTYNEVKIANGEANPNLIEDWKSWDNSKKAMGAVVVIIVALVVIGGVASALGQHNDNTSHSSYNSPSTSTHTGSSGGSSGSSSSGSSSSSSSSGSSGSYSSSSNGRDVSSHYEGEYGSSDTHGTVYDDGSIESHQTGHTDYGDYQIDSYMDSDGNVHGTVDVGGRTYYVNT